MDTASLARSLASGTTYLNDPVTSLLGHPAAKVISEQCVNDTVQLGCRLVTHYSTGAIERSKPFRWMFLRRVPWQQVLDVLEADPEHRTGTGDHPEADHPEATWHCVISELTKKVRGAPIICASFFLSNFDVLFSIVRGKFELLEEDDPEIIQAALQDEDFQAVLQLYFQTGSPDNPKFLHTLATASPLEGSCLLHYCCERNFLECVRMLLSQYTPQTAPADQPWLQLADPLWQESNWKNSAFSIAAYWGYTDLFALLWAWAGEHGLQGDAMLLKDKKGRNLCEILEERIKRFGRREGAEAFLRTFNIVAAAFGELSMPMPTPACRPPARDAQMIIDVVGEKRRVLTFHPDPMYLAQLQEKVPAGYIEGSSVVFRNLQFFPSVWKHNEARAARRLLHGLSGCSSVRFMKCSAPMSVSAALVAAAAEVLRTGSTEWTSLGIVPQWSESLEESVPAFAEFAASVEDFVAAVQETCGSQGLVGFDVPSAACFPARQKHLVHVLAHIFTMKRVAFTLTHPGQTEDDLRSKLQDDFSAHNPLLSGVATIERKLLQKGRITFSETVPEAMSGEWRDYTSLMVHSLVTHVVTSSQWMPKVGLDEHSPNAAVLLRMADEALLYLLKMRPSHQRPGLDVVSVMSPILQTISGTAAAAAFSATLGYMRDRRL